VKALALALALLASGCGASVVGVQARAATIAAVATQGAARVVEDAARVEAQTACPLAPRSPEMAACLAPLRERWAPADAGIASTRAALTAWVETLELARLADDGADLWQPLALAAARLVVEYGRLADSLRGLGLDVPGLPVLVTQAAGLLGGE
jgi:hypothetical protein